MEISGSVTKRSFSNSNGAFTSHKSVYDDVFGGHTKNGGIPVLAPRLDDYSEIFCGFHASRSSSIPLIHLPFLNDDPKLHFDVRSPGFSYHEVFGELGASACTASFEDIVRQSSGYDSSDETWSPGQGVSTSDELGPFAGSEKINKLPRSNKHLDSSHCKSSRKHVESGFTRNGHVSSFTAGPGCTFSRCDSPAASWIEEDEHCPISVANYVKCRKESAGRLREDEHNKKCPPDQEHCRDSKTQGYDSNPSEQQGNSASMQDKPFMTVSDISLRTKPSRLPPPSRPPPGLVSKKGECGRSDSKSNVSKDDLFEMMVDGSELHFLDVEIDSTSCKKDGNDCVGVMCASIEESLEGKELMGSSSVLVEDKTDICASVCSSKEEKVLHSRREEATVSEPFGEGRINFGKSVHETSELRGVGLLHPEHIADNSADSAAWEEATGYFEVSETKISRFSVDEVEDIDEHSPLDTYLCQKETQLHAFSRMDERTQPEIREKHFILDNQLHKDKPEGSWSDRNRLKENIMRGELSNEDDLGKKVPENFKRVETTSSGEAKGNVGAMDAKTKGKALLGMRKVEERFVAMPILKQNSGKYSIIIPREAGQIIAENVDHTKTRERAGKSKESQGIEKTQNGESIKENEHEWKGSNELKENVVILKWMNGESGKTSGVPSMHEKDRDEQLDHENDINKEIVHSDEEKVILLTSKDAHHQVRNDQRHIPVPQKEAFEETTRDVRKGEGNQLEVSKIIENVRLRGDVCIQKELHRQMDETGLAETSVHEVKWDPESPNLREGNSLSIIVAGCDIGAIAAQDLKKQGNSQMLGLNQATFSPEGNEDLKSEPDSKVRKPEGDNVSFVKEDELQDLTTHTTANNTVEFPSLPKRTDTDIMKDRLSSPQGRRAQLEKMHSAKDDGVLKLGGTQLASRKIDSRESSGPCQLTRASCATEIVGEDASSVLESTDATICSMKTATSHKTKRKYKRINVNLSAKDHEAVELIRSESRMEDELKRKMEEEREREREREKDRMAVNNAALARERAYAESRERVVAEMGAAALVRQRTMPESRERLEKSSIEARLRAERAAVERATIEARQRAAERLMIQKNTADGLHVEKTVADRFSAYAGHRSLPPDLHLQNAGNWKKLQSSYSSVHDDGGKCESPQRYKARLERCQRTAYRVANALSEKSKRDLLAQIEREERNRVAETLDAEIKRWSNGKEGNLRALLSTLQYILGSDSGWQPIPLTEIITPGAVKRAYRKATLCVHPDKLQQRGATVQQKYISEKVFDLLKEAWNKLNAMEF